MKFKLLTCDGILAKDGNFYITELCPALSCFRLELEEIGGIDLSLSNIYSTLMQASSSDSFKMMQPPQEPVASPNLLSHYSRDSEKPVFKQKSSGLIPKEKCRDYLHRLVLKKETAALWVMYFRFEKINDTAERFALVLKKLIQRLKLTVTVIDAHSLAYACEHDKVLFWQLLQRFHSKLVIPKEIFRFSTFNVMQKAKLAEFLKTLPGDKVIIKPTNSSLTNGILVVRREKIVEVIDFILKYLAIAGNALAYLQRARLIEELRLIVYPDSPKDGSTASQILDIELTKFIYYWLRLDIGSVLASDRDFFLVEAFKSPQKIKNIEGSSSLAVATRNCFVLSQEGNVSTLPGHGKRCYTPELSKANPDIEDIPLTNNIYSREFLDKNPKIVTNYFVTDLKGYNKVVEVFFKNPQEQSWIRALMDMSYNDFLARIKPASVANRELMQYLESENITHLNLETTEFCWHCFKMSNTLKRCTGCSHAHYCNVDCQKKDWEIHKPECKALKTPVPASAPPSTLKDARAQATT